MSISKIYESELENITKIMRVELVSTQVVEGDRGIFGGGAEYSTPASHTNVIEKISISTLSNTTDFGDLTQTRYDLVACSNGANARGCFIGGNNGGAGSVNTIDYINISSDSNAADFGDTASVTQGNEGTSNGTSNRGVFCSLGNGFLYYITINTPGNAVSFGNLSVARAYVGVTSNGSNDRGIIAGGYAGKTTQNIIDYITISSTGDAADFGDLLAPQRPLTGFSNKINERGIFAGGVIGGYSNVLQYVTINSAGNSADFGDLTLARAYMTSCSDLTHGVVGGGYDSAADTNIMDYVTIATTGNASDFGDLFMDRSYLAGCSNA